MPGWEQDPLQRTILLDSSAMKNSVHRWQRSTISTSRFPELPDRYTSRRRSLQRGYDWRRAEKARTDTGRASIARDEDDRLNS